MKRLVLTMSAACFWLAPAPGAAQQIFSAYTTFDADRNCRHTPGRDPEDYGT